MNKSLVLLLVLLVSTVVSSDGLSSVRNVRAAIKHNPVAQKFIRGAVLLSTSALLLMPSVPAEVLASEASNSPQVIQQLSTATAAQDLISLHDIYQDFSYGRPRITCA